MSTRARLGRSCPETAPAAPDPPPAPSWSPLPLPLHFALRRDPLLFSRHARLCPGADSCAFAWTAAFSYFPRTPSTPCPCCQHCAHADLSPSGRAQAALARQARCLLISPPPHGCDLCSRPSAHVRPCRGHLPRLPRTPRDMGTRAHPSPSRAALAKEASDRHWISVPFVALSSRNLSSLYCLDHCGPHPTQHTLSPRPCGSWVPRSH